MNEALTLARQNFKRAYDQALANTQEPFRKVFLTQYYDATIATVTHAAPNTAIAILNASTFELKH